MAKSRAPSKHSRAARRAGSPTVTVPVDLTDLKPVRSTSRPSALAAQHTAGVGKKKTTARGSKAKMSTKARRRHERGLQMAEAVLERTSLKLDKSKVKGKSVLDRAKAWDLINKRAQEEEERAQEEGRKAAEDGSDDNDEDPEEGGNGNGWETDEDMDAKKEDADPTVGAEFIPVDDDEPIL